MTDADEIQRQRALGTFALIIDSVPDDEAGWRALRRALRMSRADDAWLRSRIPGAVRRGAEKDLLPTLAAVRRAGVAARLVKRNRP